MSRIVELHDEAQVTCCRCRSVIGFEAVDVYLDAAGPTPDGLWCPNCREWIPIDIKSLPRHTQERIAAIESGHTHRKGR